MNKLSQTIFSNKLGTQNKSVVKYNLCGRCWPCLPTPAVWRRPSVVTNVFEKLQIWQFNQTYNIFPTSRKKILKLFSLGPRYHRQKWKCKKPFLYLEENRNVKWNEQYGVFYVALTHRLWKCFPAKRRVLLWRHNRRGVQRGRWDVRSTWITVCTLDVSKSEANSL